MYSGSENDSGSEKENSQKSDPSYIPSDDELEVIEKSPEKLPAKKNGKRPPQNTATSQASQLKRQKRNKSPVKNKNHNDFFQNVHGFPENLSEKSIDTATIEAATAEIATVETTAAQDDSSNSIQNLQHAIEENGLVVGEDLIKSMRDEIRELKHTQLKMLRQLARVEALIKFQKDQSTAAHTENDSCIDILQSFGLPIKSNEKLNEIEQNLKAVDFKTKLVRIYLIDNHFNQFLFQHEMYVIVLLSAKCTGEIVWR